MPDGAIWAGDVALIIVGLALAALIILAARRRGAISIAFVVLGIAGTLLWALAIASAFSELIYNEVLLVLVPSDLAVPVLSAKTLIWYLRGPLPFIAIFAFLPSF